MGYNLLKPPLPVWVSSGTETVLLEELDIAPTDALLLLDSLLKVYLLLGDVILLSSLIVKVTEVLKLLRVHKDIREEHLLPGLVVKEGVRNALHTVLRKPSQVLHPLEDQLDALIHLPGLG